MQTFITEKGQKIPVQTEYKWTTGFGFITWLVFIILFFMMASFKYDSISRLKSSRTFKEDNEISSFTLPNSADTINTKFRINLQKDQVTNNIKTD